MQNLLADFQASYDIYINIGKIYVLLTCILCLFMEKTNKITKIIIIYAVISSIIILCPFGMEGKAAFFMESKLYRTGMILQVPILTAYAAACLFLNLKKRPHKIIFIAGFMLMLTAAGSFVYKEDNYFKANNKEKVFDLAVLISDCVTHNTESPKVAMPQYQSVYLRQYNPRIRLACLPNDTEGWLEYTGEQSEVLNELFLQEEPDIERVCRIAKSLECDYLILLNSQVKADNPADYGFDYVDMLGMFTVFVNNRN